MVLLALSHTTSTFSLQALLVQYGTRRHGDTMGRTNRPTVGRARSGLPDEGNETPLSLDAYGGAQPPESYVKAWNGNSIASLLVAALLGTAGRVAAQSHPVAVPSDSLDQIIAALDSAMFEASNTCDLERLATFFEEDLELYHDQTGLSRGRQSLVDAVRQNICGKVHRDLVPQSFEVYPLKGYGAVTTGIHRFCDARKHQHCFTAGGPATYMTLWHQTDEGWKIARVISYDHH